MEVMLFARLKELLGVDKVKVDAPGMPATVGDLRRLLCTEYGGEFAETLADINVFCAVNKRVVKEDHALLDSDEIAFFPPVTGG